MGNTGGQRCSIKNAERAFKYAVCQLMCGKRSDKATKCISEEGGCNSYKVFMKKIS